MSKLRRRRADRCTFPMEWGHNGEAGVTNRGGAASLAPETTLSPLPEFVRLWDE
jgi:hypothetical protein